MEVPVQWISVASENLCTTSCPLPLSNLFLHVPIISSIPLLSVDDVIQLVKSSKDQGAARLALTSKEYGLSLDQARTWFSLWWRCVLWLLTSEGIGFFNAHLNAFFIFPFLFFPFLSFSTWLIGWSDSCSAAGSIDCFRGKETARWTNWAGERNRWFSSSIFFLPIYFFTSLLFILFYFNLLYFTLLNYLHWLHLISFHFV